MYHLQVWQVYQHASIFPGENAVRINGWDEGLSSQTKSDEPTMLGMTKAQLLTVRMETHSCLVLLLFVLLGIH